MWKLTLKSALAHKLRLALTALSIVIGVSFVTGTYIFTDTIDSKFSTLITDINSGTDVAVRPEQADFSMEFGSMPEEVLAAIENVPGIQALEPSADGFAQVINADGDPIGGQGPPTIGVTWTKTPALNPLRIKDGNGRPPVTADEIVLDILTVENNGFALGDTITVSAAGLTKQFDLVGLASFGTEDSLGGATLVAFTLEESQRFLGLEGELTSIAIQAEEGVEPAELRDRVAAAIPANFDRVEAITGEDQTNEMLDDFSEQTGFLSVALLSFAGVAVFVAAFIIQNTFRIIVAQRTKELALFRAIGASKRQVIMTVLGEAVLVALIASLAGLALGIGLAYGLEAAMAAIGLDLPGGSLTLLTRTFIVAFTVGVVVTLVSAVIPAIKASHVSPVEAMRETVRFGQVKSLKLRARSGITLAAIGVGLLLAGIYGDASNGAALVGMGAMVLFIGVSVLAPFASRPIANILGWPLKRLYKTTGKLATENTKRQPRRTASTAAALMIGVALVVFVSIFANSIKSSISNTLDDSFRTDVTVSSVNLLDQEMPPGFSSEVSQEILAQPEVETVSGLRSGFTRVAGSEELINGVDPATIESVMVLDPSPGSLEALAPGNVIVLEDALEDNNWGIGDTITIEYAKTGEQPTEIIGSFSGEALDKFVISIESYNQNFANPLDTFVMVNYTDGIDEATGRVAVERVVDKYPSLQVQSQDELLADVSSQVDQLLTFFWGLLGLAIIIAVTGITNTLTLSIVERTREIGLLRAVGMSRRQVRRMIRGEAIIISLFGAILGIIIGIFFGWVMIESLSDIGLGDFAIPWVQIVVYLILAAIAGTIAAIWPARKAARMDILKAIMYE